MEVNQEPEWDARSIARVLAHALAHALRHAEAELRESCGANWRWSETPSADEWQCTRVWARRPTPRDGEPSGPWSMCVFNVLVPQPDSALVRTAIDAVAAELEEYDVDAHRFPTGCPPFMDGGVPCAHITKAVTYSGDVYDVNVIAMLLPGRVHCDQD